MKSRLHAACVQCKYEASRDEFTKNPMLAEDECPNCHGEDCDIYDAKYSTASDYTYNSMDMESN